MGNILKGGLVTGGGSIYVRRTVEPYLSEASKRKRQEKKKKRAQARGSWNGRAVAEKRDSTVNERRGWSVWGRTVSL